MRERLMAERTGDARAPDDRNWLEIQVLALRVQAICSVAARFALHVFSPVPRASDEE
jgi:hypothetical protein